MAKLVIREKLKLKLGKDLCKSIENLKRELPKKKIKKDEEGNIIKDKKGKEIERIKEVITDLIEDTGFEQASPPTYGVEKEIDPGEE